LDREEICFYINQEIFCLGVYRMRIVIRIGGSIIGWPPEASLIREYAEVLMTLKSLGHQFVVIVGGGSLARNFIQLAREVGLNDKGQDEVAISVSRLFAQILAIKLGGFKAKQIPTSVDDAAQIFKAQGVAFMGGLKPEMTTDAVAAMVASRIRADLIVKATDQDGLYTKDPRKYPDAEKIDELSFEDLSAFLEEEKHRVGIHQILDPKAVQLLKKVKIETIVVNGFQPPNLVLAVKGKKVGTKIH